MESTKKKKTHTPGRREKNLLRVFYSRLKLGFFKKPKGKEDSLI